MTSLRAGILAGGLLWAVGALLLAAVGYYQLSRLWISVLCLLALALMAAGVVAVVVSLLPLKRLQGRLGPVRSGTAEQLDGAYPEEVQPLVDDLNQLLRRNQEALKRSRLEADNLAHGLKTPLAIRNNELERSSETGELAIEEMRRQVEELIARVELHLSRARAAATRLAQPPESVVEIAPVVDGLLRTMRRLHQARELVIEAAVPEGSVLRGDREDLEEMLGNVLDNACKWATARVEIEVEELDDRVSITVDDDGPGLSREGRAALSRGERPDGEGGAGAGGMGLVIVRTLVELYDGATRVDPSPLGGLRVVLDLPRG